MAGWRSWDQDAGIHGDVIIRRSRCSTKCPAGHENDAAAVALHPFALMFIGGDDVVERDRLIGVEMIGSGAAGDQAAGRARFGKGAAIRSRAEFQSSPMPR